MPRRLTSAVVAALSLSLWPPLKLRPVKRAAPGHRNRADCYEDCRGQAATLGMSSRPAAFPPCVIPSEQPLRHTAPGHATMCPSASPSVSSPYHM